MADSPIGITFMPTADAAANGPRQASIEGQGGSDLVQAFKILSLHLPNILGAGAIAPKRLLTAQGSAGVGGGGFNPYSAVFQALLQSMGGGTSSGSLSSLLGGGSAGATGGGTGDGTSGGGTGGGSGDGGSGGGGGGGGGDGTGGGTVVPSPRITPGKDYKPATFGGSDAPDTSAYSNVTNDTQYI